MPKRSTETAHPLKLLPGARKPPCVGVVFARTQAELAHVLGVSQQHLQRWLAATRHDASLQKQERGYDLAAWVRYRLAGMDTGDTEGESKGEADRRRAIAQANLSELKEQAERGELIAVSEAHRRQRALVMLFVGMVESAASELTAQLATRFSIPTADTRNILRDYFNSKRTLLLTQLDTAQ